MKRQLISFALAFSMCTTAQTPIDQKDKALVLIEYRRDLQHWVGGFATCLTVDTSDNFQIYTVERPLNNKGPVLHSFRGNLNSNQREELRALLDAPDLVALPKANFPNVYVPGPLWEFEGNIVRPQSVQEVGYVLSENPKPDIPPDLLQSWTNAHLVLTPLVAWFHKVVLGPKIESSEDYVDACSKLAKEKTEQ